MVMGQADEQARAALERDVVERWKPFVEDGVFTIRPRMLVATASK